MVGGRGFGWRWGGAMLLKWCDWRQRRRQRMRYCRRQRRRHIEWCAILGRHRLATANMQLRATALDFYLGNIGLADQAQHLTQHVQAKFVAHTLFLLLPRALVHK